MSIYLFRKRKPPMKVENLIDDLKDGVRLLALLEVFLIFLLIQKSIFRKKILFVYLKSIILQFNTYFTKKILTHTLMQKVIVYWKRV